MISFVLAAALSAATTARTTADMRTIWSAVSAYRQDHGVYPAAASMDELETFVSPRYILHLPKTDATGQPFTYETDATRQHARIAGTGVVVQDGVFFGSQVPAGTSVVIHDERRVPLAGVIVTFRRDDRVETRVSSDADGTVMVPAVAGNYVVAAELSGFYGVRFGPITVAPATGASEPLDITMVARTNVERGGVHGVVRKPILMKRVEPVCEPTNDDSSAEPIVEVTVGKSGAVEGLRVVRGVATAYTRGAERALRDWRFEPATLNTRPVTVLLYVRVQGCWISEPFLNADAAAK